MLEAITIVALFAMVVTTLIGVLDRFLLGLGLPWPEELARFLLIWTSLLAAAIAAKHRSHFGLTFLSERLGCRWQDVIDALCIAALIIVAWEGFRLASFFHLQRSPALNLPMSYVYASVPVSSVLIAYYIAQNAVARWRSSTKPGG
jgi:TRAP-type C4-dicarboxylate transport system permease small subunit